MAAACGARPVTVALAGTEIGARGYVDLTLAAGGTALATGVKTYDGAIAVDTSQRPVGTILEGAERKGLATGLVVTSRLTHATPAVFSAHVADRDLENEIARQQLNKDIEVLLGGGRRHFIPETMNGSARNDEKNLLNRAQKQGYDIVETADELAAVDDGPVLGLFSDSHMAYEIDRDETDQPSLATLTQRALDLLSDGEAGFYVVACDGCGAAIGTGTGGPPG